MSHPFGTIGVVRTIVLGPRPPEIEHLIATRHARGADHHDEVWEGDYHMAPAANNRHNWLQLKLGALLMARADELGLTTLTEFNIGVPHDHRIPDLGVLRQFEPADWNPTALLVVEIVSPHDESWMKFDFYFDHDVREVVIVDPAQRSVSWFGRGEGGYQLVDHSDVLEVEVASFVDGIVWPPVE